VFEHTLKLLYCPSFLWTFYQTSLNTFWTLTLSISDICPVTPILRTFLAMQSHTETSFGRKPLITSWFKVCQWLARVRWFSSDTPVTATNKTYLHDITEIMLKVVFNTITLPLPQWEICFQFEISNTIFLNVCLFGLLCFMLFS
jgi:hypothetical protein